MLQNFSVCDACSELCSLYHNLHHQKQKLYVMCSEIVEKRKTNSPGIDTTQILNQLLADDTWLEAVSCLFSGLPTVARYLSSLVVAIPENAGSLG